jgi:hypothetical protein
LSDATEKPVLIESVIHEFFSELDQQLIGQNQYRRFGVLEKIVPSDMYIADHSPVLVKPVACVHAQPDLRLLSDLFRRQLCVDRNGHQAENKKQHPESCKHTHRCKGKRNGACRMLCPPPQNPCPQKTASVILPLRIAIFEPTLVV